ncbi:tumor necrosis factor receptor superfamily member 27 [Diceros bicornis minor]|uniref:tumor necrosis factor receptor superfamily member 27 n=1 Tax=Diceros bicornis minor TaxID=77932 RepID=UPI0026F24FCE|nr:tumor necrosis factor receptor superfamily member 27 [Diceros bicornis minor]
MDCQENEYWDQWGQCVTCQLCGPAQELSKYHQEGAFQLSLVKADVPTVTPQEATLVALVSSLLLVFTLAFLGVFFLYCKQFFNRHCQRGVLLQFEADEAAEEESLFPMPPGQETGPESPLSESIFETQPLNPILDDDCSSTHGFLTQKSFTMASCTSESHSHWVHSPIEFTEMDLQKFSSSASYTRAETFVGNTDESSGDRAGAQRAL